MKYVQVKNWRKYQNYEGRRPDWIKMYTDLLNPVEQPVYAALTDGAKLTLFHLRLLAATTDNRTPETWVTGGTLNMKTKPKLDELISAGFVTLHDVGHDACHNLTNDEVITTLKPSLSKSKSDSDSFDQEEAFSRVWADVLAARIPKPVRKAIAFNHFRSSVKDDATLAEVFTALAKYRVSERVARGFVQDASTWFHDWRQWLAFDDVTHVTTSPDGLSLTSYAVTGADIADLQWELRQDEWTRDVPREVVASYVETIRTEFVDRLHEAPTLTQYASEVTK